MQIYSVIVARDVFVSCTVLHTAPVDGLGCDDHQKTQKHRRTFEAHDKDLNFKGAKISSIFEKSEQQHFFEAYNKNQMRKTVLIIQFPRKALIIKKNITEPTTKLHK